MVVKQAVVGLPQVVAARQQAVGLAVVGEDKADATQPGAVGSLLRQAGEPDQVNAAGPIGRDLERRRRLPLALAEAPRADGGTGCALPWSGPSVVISRAPRPP